MPLALALLLSRVYAVSECRAYYTDPATYKCRDATYHRYDALQKETFQVATKEASLTSAGYPYVISTYSPASTSSWTYYVKVEPDTYGDKSRNMPRWAKFQILY